MSKRKSNWPSLLTLFIEEKKNLPFEWGQNDCCMFTAEWICILTGQYPETAKKLRGTYNTSEGAAKIIEAIGGVEIILQKEADLKGWKSCPIAFAQRGDLALIDTDNGPSLGVVIGASVIYAGRLGCIEMPINKCRKAWRVE